MNRNELEVVAARERRGGSFVSALAAAFRHADADNFRRLREAFPDYSYAEESEPWHAVAARLLRESLDPDALPVSSDPMLIAQQATVAALLSIRFELERHRPRVPEVKP